MKKIDSKPLRFSTPDKQIVLEVKANPLTKDAHIVVHDFKRTMCAGIVFPANKSDARDMRRLAKRLNEIADWLTPKK